MATSAGRCKPSCAVSTGSPPSTSWTRLAPGWTLCHTPCARRTTQAPDAARVDVRLVDLTRRFGDVTAVDSVSLDIGRGEFFTLLGPSGSGKTTTLRLIAGFELPDAGRVELAGTDVTGRPPHARDVNTVFQDYALFPHMTVRENVEYGLRIKKVAARPAPHARRGGARDGAPGRLRRAQAGAAVRRPAPARRARAGDRQPPAGAAARRAARRAGPQAAPGDAGRAQAHPGRGRHHLRLRHPRPGGGADDERPPGRVQRGAHRAGRHARRRLRASGQRVRGRLRGGVERRRARRAAVHDPARRRSACWARARPPTACTWRRAPSSDVAYVGMVTRYLVALDAGGELQVVRQNLETSSQEAQELRGRRVQGRVARGADVRDRRRAVP